eukprot:g2103.t1
MPKDLDGLEPGLLKLLTNFFDLLKKGPNSYPEIAEELFSDGLAKVSRQTLFESFKAVKFEDFDFEKYGGLKPDSDPFDATITVASKDPTSSDYAEAEFRFAVQKRLRDGKLTISNIWIGPPQHVVHAARTFLGYWRLGMIKEINDLLKPNMREKWKTESDRSYLLKNITATGKLQSIGLAGQDDTTFGREKVSASSGKFNAMLTVKSERQTWHFLFKFEPLNPKTKTFPTESISEFDFYSDEMKEWKEQCSKSSPMQSLQEQMEKFDNFGMFRDKDHKNVFGVQTGQRKDSASASVLIKTDLSVMGAREKEIFLETFPEEAEPLDAPCSADITLKINEGDILREVPSYELNPTLVNREATDTWCRLVFFLYWAIVVGVSIYAFFYGNPNRLWRGVDHLGFTCGDPNTRPIQGALLNTTVDLTKMPYLWMPGGDPEKSICVAKCPTGGNFSIDDYTAILESRTPKANYSNVTATISLLNRCVPKSLVGEVDVIASVNSTSTNGTNATLNSTTSLGTKKNVSKTTSLAVKAISTTASLLSDVVQGWTSFLIGSVVSMFMGLLWLILITFLPTLTMYLTLSAAVLSALGLIAIVGSEFAKTFAPELLNSVPASLRENMQDFSAGPILILGALVFVFILLSYLIPLVRFRYSLNNSKKIMRQISKFIGDVGIAVYLFPIFNFLVFGALFIAWLYASAHVFTLGRLAQQCVCASGLTNCVCTSSFEFDFAARVFGLFLFLGLLWSISMIISVSELTASSLVSLWFFCQDTENGRRRVTFFIGPIFDAYFRNLWTHLGSIALLSALRPYAVIALPFVRFIQRQRESISLRYQTTRLLLAMVLKYLCFWETIAYLN